MDGRAAGDHAGQAGQAGNARQARQAPVHRADRYTGQAGQAATGRPRQRGVENGSGTASEESGLDLLLALSAVPTAVLGRNGDIVDVNDAFRVWSGHSTEQLAGMRIHDLLDSSEHAGLDHDLERVGRPGSASGRVRAERAVVPATGRRIWAIVDLVAMPTAGGPPGLVSQWLDVTELSDHEERQRQRALEDGELASFVSALVRADDPEAVLTEAAARVAAVIGDACAVFRAEGATRLREFTWQSRRPDALDPDRPLTVDFSAGTRSGPLAKVLRSGRRVSELAADVAALRAQLPAQFRRPLDLLGVSSAVFVPVRVLGAVAGVVVAYRFAGSPAYTGQDIAFLDEFGVHASLAFERAVLKDRLRQSDERFHACLNTVLEAVAVLRSVRDESGAIVDFEWVHVNDAGCRMNGRPREQIVGQRLLAAHPASRDAGLFAEFREVTESGRTLTKSGLRDGSSWFGRRPVSRVLDLRAARLGDGFVLAWRDVTEQLEHVAALERYARHHEVLAAVSAAFGQAGGDLDGVVAAVVRELVTHLADFVGVALLSSDAAQLDSAIAFAAGSAVGLAAEDLATKPIPLAADGPHQRAFHTGQPVVCNQLDDDGRLELTPEHGRLIEHLQLTCALYVPLRACSGTTGVLTLARTGPRTFSDDDIALAADVADRAALAIDSARLSAANEQAHRTLRASEAELRRSNHDLEQFAYVISHDLQAPLRTVRGYIDLVARKIAQRSGEGDAAGRDRSVDDYLRAITGGVSRMQDLIRGLLAYSRVGSLIPDPTPVDANVLVGNVLAALRGTIESAGATVTYDRLPTVAVDARQFEQLLQNLIENAIKFRGVEAPVVHVSAWRERGVWAFAVTDNGIGLDPAHSERIFEVFHRLHTVDRYPGAGIGLAIGNKIVQRHGGAMRVQSSPGRGATFSFTIPDRATGG